MITEPANNPSAGRFACTADRIFDGHQVHTDRAVVVDGGVIIDLVLLTALPANLTVVSGAGCTIIPGLIDAHMHFMRWQGPAYLAYGVTTVRDTGNNLPWILDRRREASDRPWPRLLSLGPILDGPKPFHPAVSRGCKTPADGVDAVRETLDAGADGIKLYVGLPADWLPSMVRHCHARGFKASIHCGGSGLRAVLRSGVDEFFHHDGVLADIWPGGHPPGWLDAWGDRGMGATRDAQRHLADEIRAAGITATPTLAYWDSQWRIRRPEGHGAEAAALVPPLIAKWQSTGPDPAASDRWRRALDAARRFTGLLLEREVPVLAGTDVPCGAVPPGLSLWHELRLLNEAGMSPAQALRAATVDVATFMRRPDLGRLGSGAAADLVVVHGNPLAAIPHSPDIVRVMRNGVWHEPATLLTQMERMEDHASLGADPWTRQFERHYQP